MSQVIATLACCDRCGREFRSDDRFCGQCGAPIQIIESALSVGPGNTVGARGSDRSFLHNRFAVIGLLVCLGPLGLPLLWLSNRFSRLTKIITSVICVLLTVVAPAVIIFYFLGIAVRPLLNVFGHPG